VVSEDIEQFGFDVGVFEIAGMQGYFRTVNSLIRPMKFSPRRSIIYDSPEGGFDIGEFGWS